MTFLARGVWGNLPMVTMSGPLWTSFSTSRRILRRSTSRFFRTLAATPLPSLINPKQDVLGANVFVVEALRFLVGQLHDLAGTIGESFVHFSFFPKSGSGRNCANPFPPCSPCDLCDLYKRFTLLLARLFPSIGVVRAFHSSLPSRCARWRAKCLALGGLGDVGRHGLPSGSGSDGAASDRFNNCRSRSISSCHFSAFSSRCNSSNRRRASSGRPGVPQQAGQHQPGIDVAGVLGHELTEQRLGFEPSTF